MEDAVNQLDPIASIVLPIFMLLILRLATALFRSRRNSIDLIKGALG